MSLFSQRKGIQPAKSAIQRESVDESLRNKLWTALKLVVWDHYDSGGRREVHGICQLLWHEYFKEPIDTLPQFLPDYSDSGYRRLRTYFFSCEWWQVYDFIEFVLKQCPDQWADKFREFVNVQLEAENAAYRIVGNEIADISDEHEIGAIDDALTGPFYAARQHLTRALELLSDKNSPDYRNSVKESVSAVESAAQEISGKTGATLGDCIKAIEKNGNIHPALKSGLLKLYGYSSDSGGIRHAISEGDAPPTYGEAKFMLVACAGFVNLLATKKSRGN